MDRKYICYCGFYCKNCKGMVIDRVCVSCKEGSGDPNCAVRKCAQEKDVEMCAMCESYPCELFKEYFGDYPLLSSDNEILREKGMDEWSKLQDERQARGFTYSGKDDE